MCRRCELDWTTDLDAIPDSRKRYGTLDRPIALGLHPMLDLSKACAEFYLLERLEADGSRTAKRLLRELEDKLTREFATYIDMASGGELRHYPRGRASCGCGRCDEDCEIVHECGVDDYAECANLDYDPDYDEYKPCFANGNYIPCPSCRPDGDVCEYRSQRNTDGVLAMLPIVERFLDEDVSTGDRTGAWESWLARRRVEGRAALAEMVRAFLDGPWGGGFGGEAWGNAARLVLDLIDGKISRRVFLNMAWSTEHNGGCIFNKVYDTGSLNRMLEAQARDDYDYLASKACYTIRALWRMRAAAKAGALDRSAEWLGTTFEVEW